MSMTAQAFILLVFLFTGVYYMGLRSRFIHIWLGSYIASRTRQKRIEGQPVHIMFCFVDHYEPLVGKVDVETGRKRVQKWLDWYPGIADKYPDSDDCAPSHSFFYPQDEYCPEYLSMLEPFCAAGYGEVEIHIHHDGDTEKEFIDKMQSFANTLHDEHGFLPKKNGKPQFAFIHGNWALDNSRVDGKWCGLNNELVILNELGCYADFTLPSAPSDTQTKTINDIYYAIDDPEKQKSHNVGISLEVGGIEQGDLLIIQGPLTLNWKRRSYGIWPRIENGDVTPTVVPIEERVDMWVKEGIHVKGRPEWVFVKVHTHGAHDRNSTFLFDNGGFERMFQHLHDNYNDGINHFLHYVSAREIFNIIKAAESGKTGNPSDYRDFILETPLNAKKNV